MMVFKPTEIAISDRIKKIVQHIRVTECSETFEWLPSMDLLIYIAHKYPEAEEEMQSLIVSHGNFVFKLVS